MENIKKIDFDELLNHVIVSSPLKIRGGGVIPIFEIQTKRGHEKIAQKQGGQLKRGGGGSLRKGSFQIVSSVFLKKNMFHYYWNIFFCLVNIHTCCNQQICSFMWFTFYQKMIYYEISFPFTLIFKYNFVKILLLMTFISIFISLKTSNFIKDKSQVFKRNNCTITVHNDLYYNEFKI